MIIIDAKVISRKFLSLIKLPRAYTPGIYKLPEVFDISEDKNLVFAAFQIVVPSFESHNKARKF